MDQLRELIWILGAIGVWGLFLYPGIPIVLVLAFLGVTRLMQKHMDKQDAEEAEKQKIVRAERSRNLEIEMDRMDDEDREEWVNNVESLYDEYIRSHLPMEDFVRRNRDHIDSIANAELNREPQS